MKKKVSNDSAYWGETLKLLGIVLIIWIGVSFGASIVFVEFFNKFSLGGYPLGFWFAQQGSIYTYIILILVYIRVMGKLDRKYDVHEDEKGGK